MIQFLGILAAVTLVVGIVVILLLSGGQKIN
jgi:hypothetical protein